MINLNVHEFCHDCLDFKPVRKEVGTTWDKIDLEVQCKHHYKCGKLAEHIRGELTKPEKKVYYADFASPLGKLYTTVGKKSTNE